MEFLLVDSECMSQGAPCEMGTQLPWTGRDERVCFPRGCSQGSLCICLCKLHPKSTYPPLCLWSLKAIHPFIAHNTVDKQKNKWVKEVVSSCPMMCPRGFEIQLNQATSSQIQRSWEEAGCSRVHEEASPAKLVKVKDLPRWWDLGEQRHSLALKLLMSFWETPPLVTQKFHMCQALHGYWECRYEQWKQTGSLLSWKLKSIAMIEISKQITNNIKS